MFLRLSQRLFTRPLSFRAFVTKRYEVQGELDLSKSMNFVSFSKKDGKETMISDPMETLLKSLCACQGTTARYLSYQMNVRIDEFKVLNAEGELDLSGFKGENPDAKSKFEKIKMVIKMKTNAPKDIHKKLEKEVEKRCPVTVMLRDAGCDVQIDWIE